MSLSRFVYYCAVIGGWAAFIAWVFLERPIRHLGSLGESAAAIDLWSIVTPTVTATGVGGAIGCGLGLVGGADQRWFARIQNGLSGLIGGAVGGLIGGLVGAILFTYAGLPQALGWMIMGLAIGAAEGLHQNSFRRVRNGAIGGALGGLLGGFLFGLLARPGAEMASRAFAFVALGTSIGALIGLTHVVLKRAWLTVMDGFRPGRQLILDQDVILLGRGDHLPLPLLGPSSRDLEAEHARITRRGDGTFVLEDRDTRLGTLLNGQRLVAPTILFLMGICCALVEISYDSMTAPAQQRPSLRRTQRRLTLRLSRLPRFRQRPAPRKYRPAGHCLETHFRAVPSPRAPFVRTSRAHRRRSRPDQGPSSRHRLRHRLHYVDSSTRPCQCCDRKRRS